MTTRIRVATSLDHDYIRDVHLCAFPEGENQLVANLASNLLKEETNLEIINLVADIDGCVVGHAAFSPVTVFTKKNWVGYILGPLGVKPDYQKRGIGLKLIQSGIKRLTEKGINVVFVYGDPKYYGKFGFKADSAINFLPPYDLQYPFGWQALVLHGSGFNKQRVKISCVESFSDPALW